MVNELIWGCLSKVKERIEKYSTPEGNQNSYHTWKVISADISKIGQGVTSDV